MNTRALAVQDVAPPGENRSVYVGCETTACRSSTYPYPANPPVTKLRTGTGPSRPDLLSARDVAPLALASLPVTTPETE